MLGIVICEDNREQREKINRFVENEILIDELDLQIRLVTDSPRSVIDYVKESKEVNIYFLDIDLQNNINGIELAVEIRKYDPRGFIVFITTHSEMTYLTFKYKVEAMDFILKDNSKEINDRVKECIENGLKRYGNESAINNNKVFTVRIGERNINIPYEEIMFFETSTTVHKLKLHCNNRIVEFYGKIKELEENLDSRFCRCHRAYIINKENITEINKSKRYALMKSGEKCYISARQIGNF